MLPDHEAVARRIAAGQHGLLTRRQLRTAGLGRSTVRNLVDSGRWHEVTDEVLRLDGAPRTSVQRLLCGVLDTGGPAWLSHLSAASHWGLSGCPSDPVHAVRTGSSRRRTDLAVVHQVRALPSQWTTVLDGVPVVRPELLALHLFAHCSEGRAERLVERLWADRLLSGPSLRRFLAQLGARGRNGTAGLRRYLDERGPGYIPAATGVESRTVQILRDAGIEVRRQVDVGDEVQWTGRVDLVVEGMRVVIEVQSERHHSALTDVVSDAARIAALEAGGWIVVPIEDVLIWTQPGEVVRRVEAAIRAARQPRP